MQVRDWLRPPRQLLVVFLAVALVSATALGWLGWLLLAQDKALDVQRQQDRIEQAADRAAAVMQRSLTNLQSLIGPQLGKADPLPAGVLAVSLAPSGIVVNPAGSLLYFPVRRASPGPSMLAFTDGERLEFSNSDPAGAARVYSGLSTARNEAIRAGALARLARVRRKLRDPDGALAPTTSWRRSSASTSTVCRRDWWLASDAPASLTRRREPPSFVRKRTRFSRISCGCDGRS